MRSATTTHFVYRWLTAEDVEVPWGKTSLILAYLFLNYVIVFVDVLIAHSENSFFPLYEWIPIIYSPLAALAALLLLLVPRSGLSRLIYFVMMFAGTIIGVLGFGFHLQASAAGNSVSFAGLINSNPVFAPLAFVALGLIGLLAGRDDRPDYRKYGFTNKTRHLLFVTAFWFFATGLVAFFDHARTGFTNVYTWVPVYTGIFAGMVVLLQAFSREEKGLSLLYIVTIALCLAVGLLGFAFHLTTDLAGRGSIVWAKIFYEAPGLAPLLFSDIGIWAALVFLDPLPKTAG
ncbi:hypothetical protein REC12_01700 [Desulfosporosinus sp. PR]|uniref:hypothetical protein n=1 Tax=Candidatus Desulfosporosinus nitrosoreducens TaxID=3401928 RepID=UPI0027FBC3FE|nr:hypothetical protein [Desulfosporosinus sp. PR]MDQ7092306.1 hypothetical protein [Desulfosporosinus sp. PR]